MPSINKYPTEKTDNKARERAVEVSQCGDTTAKGCVTRHIRSHVGHLLAAVLMLTMAHPLAAQKAVQKEPVIIYDNDVHCSIAGYGTVAALRDSLRREGHPVCLVSCGDYVSGAPIGAISQGEYIVSLMNAAGYDFVTLGNHEFDYGIEVLCHNVATLTAQTVCCNFRATNGDGCSEDSRPILRYAIKEMGKERVAFIGVCTPSAIASSTPTFFMDADGTWRYTFSADDIAVLVQAAADEARTEGGATKVVVLAHLGDSEDPTTTSTSLIRQTRGIDAVLDGHEHHTIARRLVPNADGHPVVLSSTGSHFEHVGLLSIAPNGAIGSRLLTTATLSAADSSVARAADSVTALYNAIGQRHIGINDTALAARDTLGRRITRMTECGLGNFCADALRHATGSDVAVVNGGGIRENLPAGEITFNTLFAIMPFQQTICVAEVSGADLLDVLETAYRKYPMEYGGFLQVSGLKVVIDTNIESHVIIDSNGIFSHIDGRRRIVAAYSYDTLDKCYHAIDPQHTYTIAGGDYTLLKQGDGIRFNNLVPHPFAPMKDTEALEMYIESLGSTIPRRYTNNEGRIIFK